MAARLQVLSAVMVKLLTFWCSGVWCSGVGCCSRCFEKFRASFFIGQAVQKERIIATHREPHAERRRFSSPQHRILRILLSLEELDSSKVCPALSRRTLRPQLQTFCVNRHVTKFVVTQTHNIEIS